jgi:hypothetical protein
LDIIENNKELNNVGLFNEIFTKISPSIQFSNSKLDSNSLKLNQIITPVYWQHIGYGPTDGALYKSILVNFDTIKIKQNCLGAQLKIEGKMDSVEIVLDVLNNEISLSNNVSVKLYSWGWKNGLPSFRPFTKITYLQGYINTPNVVPLHISFHSYSSKLLTTLFH